MQRFVRLEDVDAELAYKADHSNKKVRVDFGLVVGKCRVVGAAVLQQNGHTFSGAKASPEVCSTPKVVWEGVQK